ncbi:MAG: hypothetical protein ACUVTL_07670 [Thermoproteota archaeon]
MRDGIHGREYISTLYHGRRLSHLEFDGNGKIVSDIPSTVDIPVPIILDAPIVSGAGRNILLALAKVATTLKTFAILDAMEYWDDLKAYRANLIP